MSRRPDALTLTCVVRIGDASKLLAMVSAWKGFAGAQLRRRQRKRGSIKSQSTVLSESIDQTSHSQLHSIDADVTQLEAAAVPSQVARTESGAASSMIDTSLKRGSLTSEKGPVPVDFGEMEAQIAVLGEQVESVQASLDLAFGLNVAAMAELSAAVKAAAGLTLRLGVAIMVWNFCCHRARCWCLRLLWQCCFTAQ